ncbi:uncharacterized protein LOC129001160 [Macrosteles quadrilineatus]|uniref:uncharacterized protein LOC129001160 n=1 Tax=Macrosteles quadrilineatus TaxID=74068 RepID=UPI0023E2A56D|nr:uncharacterized protein LOC129001160 [Macrosteles quadrilineatus]
MNVCYAFIFVSFMLFCSYLPVVEAGGILELLGGWSGLKLHELGIAKHKEHDGANQVFVGAAFAVVIEQKSKDIGQCKEKITITSTAKRQEKKLSTKCAPYGKIRKVKRGNDDAVVVGTLDSGFCAFLPNGVKGDEFYYLMDGKWKQGIFGVVSSDDKDLTETEINEAGLVEKIESVLKHKTEIKLN